MYVVLGNGASNVEARQESHMSDWDRSPHIPIHSLIKQNFSKRKYFCLHSKSMFWLREAVIKIMPSEMEVAPPVHLLKK